MKILVNNESMLLPASESLLDLINRIGMGERKGIAVAINQSIVPRGTWETTELKDQDSVSIIHATQGG